MGYYAVFSSNISDSDSLLLEDCVWFVATTPETLASPNNPRWMDESRITASYNRSHC